MQQICDDFDAEYLALRELVADLDEERWRLPTPAEGWSIHDQIGHLAYFDEKAVLAHRDPERFSAELARLVEDLGALEREHLARSRPMSGAEVLAWWDRAHAELVSIYRTLDPRERVLWYGPPMAAKSKITARIMEVFAHGRDVADALGVEPEPTDRLRHVCHLGVRARDYAYMVNELAPPAEEVYVELRGPSGDVWTWGDPSAPDRVSGPALDFALVVTRRRHLADTALVVDGPVAAQWMSIAQAFAGPGGPGRRPKAAS